MTSSVYCLEMSIMNSLVSVVYVLLMSFWKGLSLSQLLENHIVSIQIVGISIISKTGNSTSSIEIQNIK